MRIKRTTRTRQVTAAAICAVVAIGLSSPVPAGATTYLVDKEGGGDFLNISAAIAAAADGDTLLVAAGSYSGEDNWYLDFQGKNLVLISRGGPNAAKLYGGGSLPPNGQLFYLHSGEDGRAIIDGFLIYWGKSDSLGGLVYLNGASPTFVNCEFRDGEASLGGSIYCANAAPVFIDCKIRRSEATLDGGGVYCANSSPHFLRCDFFEHYAGRSGGAGYFVSSTPLIEECAISLNDATEDGGGFVLLDCPSGSVIDLCTFRQNYSRRGAGLWFGGAAAVGVAGCMMVDGNAYLQGSNVFCGTESSPAFETSILSFGLHGEAIYCETGADPSFLHCLVYGNAAGDSLCGNRSENLFDDPLFCDFYALDYSVCSNSPCLPENNEWGILIGDRIMGCDACNTAVEPMSWGAIKALFR